MENEKPQQPSAPEVDVTIKNIEVDFASQFESLCDSLGALISELRFARGAIDDDVAMFCETTHNRETFRITSGSKGVFKIEEINKNYMFEADLTKNEGVVMREFKVVDDELIETEPGQDEAGCQTIARSAYILARAAYDDAQAEI